MAARAILYSPLALKGEGFELILAHVADPGPVAGLPRTVLRLMRLGEPVRALRLAAALASR